MTDRLLQWWRGLAWYWRIPASIVLVLAGVTLLVELLPALRPERKAPDAWLVDEVPARLKRAQERREELEKKIKEIDAKYERREAEIGEMNRELDDVESKIDRCDDVGCVDDVLRVARERRKGRRGGA